MRVAVRALRRGYFGMKIREVGDVFAAELKDRKVLKGSWMEEVNPPKRGRPVIQKPVEPDKDAE